MLRAYATGVSGGTRGGQAAETTTPRGGLFQRMREAAARILRGNTPAQG